MTDPTGVRYDCVYWVFPVCVDNEAAGYYNATIPFVPSVGLRVSGLVGDCNGLPIESVVWDAVEEEFRIELSMREWQDKDEDWTMDRLKGFFGEGWVW